MLSCYGVLLTKGWTLQFHPILILGLRKQPVPAAVSGSRHATNMQQAVGGFPPSSLSPGLPLCPAVGMSPNSGSAGVGSSTCRSRELLPHPHSLPDQGREEVTGPLQGCERPRVRGEPLLPAWGLLSCSAAPLL